MSESTSAAAETHHFQAEIQQLLNIVIHSLYTEREIFVRELVSNASDALEKLRHLQLTEKDIADPERPLEIRITTDDTAGIFTIEDSGVGMTRSELVENLGTIAHSGSKAFLEALKQAGQAGQTNPSLIGQFGVGFYSVFMAAESVEVFTRSWKPGESSWLWKSQGAGTFQVEPAPEQPRGTRIVARLKQDCREFAREHRIEELLKRYSAFVAFPILLNGKQVNTIQAIWLRPREEITAEEYNEFFKFHAHTTEEPLLKLHFSADAPIQIHSLLFVPRHNPEKFAFHRMEPGVSIYCRKILIEERPADLLPEWLRFLKGVVDSEDLPLNISRESTQDKALLEKIGRVLSKRFVRFLEETAQREPGSYAEFYREFAPFLKEGAATDFTHSAALLKLLRFESSLTEKGELISLADYVGRMRTGQQEIFYLCGPTRQALEKSPYLEGFKAAGLEVLFCYDAADDYVLRHARSFEGKNFTAADSPGAQVDTGAAQPPGEPLPREQVEELLKWWQQLLGDRVSATAPSRRLVDSPLAAFHDEPFVSPHLRRVMQALHPGETPTPPRVRLEVNPAHPAIHKLNSLRMQDEPRARLLAEHLFDMALLAAGLVDDPSEIVRRSYQILGA